MNAAVRARVMHVAEGVKVEVDATGMALKIALYLFIGICVACTFGPPVESALFPVWTDFHASAPMKDGNRLCWSNTGTRTRDAVPVGSYAKVFVGDAPFPVFVGIQRDNGDPVGVSIYRGGYTSQVDVPYTMRMCVNVPDIGWQAYRIGVQPVMEYEDEPFALWKTQTKLPWIDYYNQAKSPQ